MDAKGFSLKPDLTGCRHSYMEGSFFKIGGMQAAKCFTCDRVVAWSIETAAERMRLTWIAEKASPGAALKQLRYTRCARKDTIWARTARRM
jgi:hypothetical protein